MAKVGSSSVRGRISSTSKATRSVQTRVSAPRGTSRNTRLTGTRVNTQYKNPARKASIATRNKLPNRGTSARKITGALDARQKKITGANAEKLATKWFRKQGAEVHPMQHDRIHGVDLGVIWRGRRGEVNKAGVVEVKGSTVRTPSRSAFAKQVRPSYYRPNLRKADAKGIKGANELYRLAKNNDKRLQSMAFTSGPQGNRVYKISPRGPISRNYQSVKV